MEEERDELYASHVAVKSSRATSSSGPSVLTRIGVARIAAAVSGFVMVVIIVALAAALHSERMKNRDANGGCSSSSNTPTIISSGLTDDVRAAKLRQQWATLPSNDSLRAFMAEFSREPHIAGSDRNNYLAQRTADMLKGWGFDEVRIDYLPSLTQNLIFREVLVRDAASNAVRYNCSLQEPNIVNQSAYEKALLPSNGYSGNGTATAPVIWANYGTKDDFDAIKQIDLAGKIVVVKYGQIFRGNKALFAQARGAVGCIIVMDPFDMDPHNATPFPNGPWATNYTVQRGSVDTGEGDPRTPFWPSEFDGPAFESPDWFNDTKMGGMALPTIPIQPMAYGDAMELLRGIGGANAFPVGWGNTTGFAGVMGGGIGPSPYNVTLTVFRELVTTRLANVHAIMRGTHEPDREVIIGSHRDAWTYGAVDPISGASCVLEVARTFGLLKNLTGWRPRRTIHFTSWDGEEYSLLGSFEYVQYQIEQLKQRAVAYINVDTGVAGVGSLDIEASPSFETVAVEIAGLYTVEGTGKTLLDMWSGARVDTPGSGSDHSGFISLAGVPIFFPGMTNPDGRYDVVYHSNYDCLEWVEKFGDPGFHGHRALTQMIGDLTLRLADLNLLTLDAKVYADRVQGWVTGFATVPANAQLANFSFINTQAAQFVSSAADFMTRRANVQTQILNAFPDVDRLQAAGITSLSVRAFNDATMGLERVFLGPPMATDSQIFQHVLFTPAADDYYGSSTMPLITDGLATKNATIANFNIGIVAQYIGRAARYLNQSVWFL